MLCGETLCGDKFVFSFLPVRMLTECRCGLTIECENRLFALTLVSIRSGGKENNAWNSTLIGWRYDRAAIHYTRAEKSCTAILDEPTRLEILTFHPWPLTLCPDLLKNLQKIMKNIRNLVKLVKTLVKLILTHGIYLNFIKRLANFIKCLTNFIECFTKFIKCFAKFIKCLTKFIKCLTKFIKYFQKS